METLLLNVGFIVLSLVCETSFCLSAEAVYPPSSFSSSAPSSVATRTTSATTTLTNKQTTVDTLVGGLGGNLERSRIARMYLLQKHVLDTLGWNSPPNIDHATKKKILAGIENLVYVSKQKHCYYPICDMPMVDFPDYMNRTLWFDKSSKNVRYYFHIPTDTGNDVDIASAVVRLHLKRREECPCASDVDPARLQIKIYQYRKPIRSHARLHHSNMRLIDAKMITWNSARWVSLQVTDAVKRISSRGRRNGGFEVHVEDMEENVMDAKSVIDYTECSSKIEYDCSNKNLEGGEEPDQSLDSNFSPRLEITTAMKSISEVSNQDQEKDFE